MIRFDEETLRGYRGNIMKRGQTLATLLSDLLGGKKSPSAIEAMGISKPGMRPEEALRMTLDAVEARRKLIDASDDRFGRCDVCGEDLGAAALGEMPWADRCAKHAAI
jgi:RNA polymerase-binding transcription factor DksA